MDPRHRPFGYDHGTYRVTIDQANRGTFVPAPWELPDAVTVEVDATKTSAGPGSFGVACRHAAGVRYSALIDINSTWRITRIDVAGAQPRRLATGRSTAIHRSGTNHMALECRRGPTDGSVQLTHGPDGSGEWSAPGRQGRQAPALSPPGGNYFEIRISAVSDA